MAGPVIVQGSVDGAATGPATVVALSSDGRRLRLLARAPAPSGRPEGDAEGDAEAGTAVRDSAPVPPRAPGQGAAPRTPTTTDGAA
ncbi:hypothetical protein [Streptomyces sp. NPDC055299]